MADSDSAKTGDEADTASPRTRAEASYFDQFDGRPALDEIFVNYQVEGDPAAWSIGRHTADSSRISAAASPTPRL
jgi:hypothetical protein